MTEVEVLERKIARGYIPDTNVLVFNPFAPYILSGNEFPREELQNQYLEALARLELPYDHNPNDVYISEVVEKELDHLAHNKEDSTVAFDARMAAVILNRIRQRGLKSHKNGVYAKLDNGAKVFFSRHDESGFNEDKQRPFSPDNDDRVVFFVKKLTKELETKKQQVIFVSQDTYARSRGLDRFCKAEEFRYENIRDPNQLYTGVATYVLNDDLFTLISDPAKVFSADELQEQFHRRLRPNQVLIFTDDKYTVIDYRLVECVGDAQFSLREFRYERLLDVRKQLNAELRRKQPDLEKILKQQSKKALRKAFLSSADRDDGDDDLPLFITPFDENLVPYGGDLKLSDQTPYFELLTDDHVPLVSVNGPQGTGKTLFAVLAGLLKVERGAHEKIRYLKPLVGADEGLGFYKGDFNQKIERWIQPCKDALKEVFGYHSAKTQKEKQLIELALQKLEWENVIEYDVVTHLAGNTWRNEFVIIDEAQYFNRRQMKLLIGRAGKGTKLVFSGDLSQTAFSSEYFRGRVNERNSGLAHIIERLPGERVYGHITLPRVENVHRSEVAGLASKL